MEKRLEYNNSYLEPFLGEINKYSEGVHNLNEGANISDIIELELSLGVKLPLNYIQFLELCNGGELFAVPAGTILFEVYNPSQGHTKNGIPYLNKSHRKLDLPKKLFAIANTSYGDIICFDLETNDGLDARIVKWSHEGNQITSSWERLIDWLMDELKIGAMLVNYDGSDKL